MTANNLLFINLDVSFFVNVQKNTLNQTFSTLSRYFQRLRSKRSLEIYEFALNIFFPPCHYIPRER